MGLGVAYDMIGDAREAQVHYRMGLQLAPNNVTLLNNLGLSLALSGDLPGSIDLLLRVVASAAATARHRQNLALAYGLSGQIEQAAAVARQDLDEEAVANNLAYYAILRGAIAGWDLHPMESAALPRRTPNSDILRHLLVGEGILQLGETSPGRADCPVAK